VKKIKDLEKFEMVKTLSFDKSEFYVDAFAYCQSDSKVKMRDSEIKKHNYFKHFSNLKSFESLCFSRESKKIKNFSKLLPLKDQLMSLDFYEDDEIDKNSRLSHRTIYFTGNLKIGL
jgi:hypothetical protein